MLFRHFNDAEVLVELQFSIASFPVIRGTVPVRAVGLFAQLFAIIRIIVEYHDLFARVP